MRNLLASLVFVFLGVASALAGRQAAQTSPEVQKAILDFQLTAPLADRLIAAMTAMTKYVTSQPDYVDRIAKTAKMSPAERRAQMEKDPGAMAILKQHSLTSQEYLIGVPALRMALMAAQGVSSPTVIASPANVAFAKANLAQLKPKMDAADGLTGRR
jgi:hypothetical protein